MIAFGVGSLAFADLDVSHVNWIFVEPFAGSFQKDIGSQVTAAANAREHPLHDALWVVQAMLRSGYSSLAIANSF